MLAKQARLWIAIPVYLDRPGTSETQPRIACLVQSDIPSATNQSWLKAMASTACFPSLAVKVFTINV